MSIVCDGAPIRRDEWRELANRPYARTRAIVTTYVPGSPWSLRRGAHAPKAVAAGMQAMFQANVGIHRQETIDTSVDLLSSNVGQSDPDVLWIASLALIHAGETAIAEQQCADIAYGAESFSREHRITGRILLARMHSLAGKYDQARALLRSTLVEGIEELMRPVTVAWLTEALVRNGNLDAAARLLDAHGFAGELDEFPDLALILAARGIFHHVQGRFHESLNDQLGCGELLTALHVANPCVVPWRVNAAVAALQIGLREQAIDLAEQELILARRWGNPDGIERALALGSHVGAAGPRPLT